MSERMCIVLVSGQREQLQMAGMMASVGAVSGMDVTVFVSMNALRYFVKGSTEAAPAEGEMGRLMEQKKAPAFRTLFEQAATLGDAKIHPCTMAMDIMGIEKEGLEPYMGESLGLTKFLSDAQGAQVWSF
ncbi:MAG: DsrE/DsrF/DrsH-like family protein [Betaproteobacteria bacterium]|nr:DsrE/DsrF/DrsH-like family protein [Betaproteobacteria bacterium]